MKCIKTTIENSLYDAPATSSPNVGGGAGTGEGSGDDAGAGPSEEGRRI